MVFGPYVLIAGGLLCLIGTLAAPEGRKDSDRPAWLPIMMSAVVMAIGAGLLLA